MVKVTEDPIIGNYVKCSNCFRWMLKNALCFDLDLDFSFIYWIKSLSLEVIPNLDKFGSNR